MFGLADNLIITHIYLFKGWHLSACYRKYRIRESLLTSHEKEGNFYVRVRVKTQLGLEEVQHNIMEHLATETPE